MIHLLTLALALSVQAPKAEAPPKRPRDPWVLRCVLDKRPRMVTIALADELWIAYDATNCGLYKAWRGGVNFDGPVYTTVHGPQPTSRGTSYVEGIEGDVWQATVGGVEGPAKARWRGYRFNGDHVALEYEIALADGRKVPVIESPEFVTPEQMFDGRRIEEMQLIRGHPGLLRTFRASDVPADVEVSVLLRTDGATAKIGESLVREEAVDATDAQGAKHTQVLSHLVMTRDRPLANVVLFFAPLPEPAKTEEKGGAK